MSRVERIKGDVSFLEGKEKRRRKRKRRKRKMNQKERTQESGRIQQDFLLGQI